jgi:hypothetical protein
MAYEDKKYPDKVEEQPGSKQKKLPEKKAPLKNELANASKETGLDHPQYQYETYKRPRRS